MIIKSNHNEITENPFKIGDFKQNFITFWGLGPQEAGCFDHSPSLGLTSGKLTSDFVL